MVYRLKASEMTDSSNYFNFPLNICNDIDIIFLPYCFSASEKSNVVLNIPTKARNDMLDI